MTATLNQTCDVFISHAVSDIAIAVEVADSLGAVGLTSFHAGTVPPDADLSDSIWDALAESRAMIVIVTPDIPFPSIAMVEIGAAAAWNKPVYVLINGPSTTKLHSALASYPVYPLGRLGEVIQAIRGSFQPLTEDERAILTDVYQRLGLSADELSQSPKALRELTTTFNKRADKQLSPERLLSELLRLQKSGQLPRLRSRN